MAKLSETYKIPEVKNTVMNGGGNSAPASVNKKLSETYRIGENTYDAPTVTFEKEIPSLKQTAPTMATNASASVPKLEEPKKQGFWSTLWSTIQGNAVRGVSPTGASNISAGYSQAVTQDTYDTVKNNVAKQNYFNTTRQQELRDFDAKDTSRVLYNSPTVKLTKAKLDMWLDPSYELSPAEVKQAKEATNALLNAKNYKQYFGDMDSQEFGKLYQSLSMLNTRASSRERFARGAAEAIPGFKALERGAAKALDKVNGDTHTSDLLKEDASRVENTTAYKVGRGVSKIGQYYVLNQSGLLEPLNKAISGWFTPRLSTALANSAYNLGMSETAINTALALGEKLGSAFGNILSDEVADILLDTLPEMAQNIRDGMGADEVKSEVLKNLGINMAYNIGGEAIPDIVKAVKNKLGCSQEAAEIIAKNSDEISNAVAKETTGETPKIKAEETKTVSETVPETKPKNEVMAEDIGIGDTDSTILEAPVEIALPEVDKTPLKELKALSPEDGPVSQFYKGGTVETVTDPKLYKEGYEPKTDFNRYEVVTDEEVEALADARLFTNGAMDPAKADAWAKLIGGAENLAKEDIATAMNIKAYWDANGEVEKAVDLMTRIRPHITQDAQVLQYLGSLKRNTLQGQIEQGLASVRQATDKKAGKAGFTDAVNNFARQIEDKIASGDMNVGDMFNKKLSDFAYGKAAKETLKKTDIDGEQMVLKLIGGYEPNKKSLKELAEEAGSVIRKANKVADITTKDEAQVIKFLNEASNYEVGTRKFKELQAKAAKVVAQKSPSSFGEKFKTFLYDNMLGNFKTAISRNMGGNILGNTLEKAQKPLKTGIDALVGLKTGERNYLLSPDVAKEYAKGFGRGVKDQTLDVLRRTHTTRSGEESFADALANVKKVFNGKNPIDKVLGAFDDAVKSAMLFGDRPFYEAEYAAAKTELNKIVDKFGKDALTNVGVPKEALGDVEATIEFLARDRALDAVYQKKGLMANGFSKLKESLSDISKGAVGADVVTQSSMPFIQVPANIFERFTDYLPGVGTFKNAVQTIPEIAKGNFNQKRFVDATSRNLTGLGLFGAGVALAENAKNGGAGITGGYSDDPDKAAAQRAGGELEYAAQLPDGTQMDISDIPVLGPMAQSASAFAESMRNTDNLGEGIAEGSKKAISSAFETSALQGLNRLFGTDTYGQGKGFGENVANVMGSALAQGVPSLVRQETQVTDPYKRDLGEYGTPRYWLNNMINATPLRMSMLNPKLDNEGNIVKQNQGRSTGMKVLEDMLLPWQISKPEYSSLGEAANEIFENSSEHTAKAYATVPSRSNVKEWAGDNYSEQTYYDAKQRTGNLNSTIGQAVINSSFFKGMTADEQADILSQVYSAAKAITREGIQKGYKSDNKIVEAFKSGGKQAVVEYLEQNYYFGQNGISKKNDDALEAYGNNGGSGLEDYVGVTAQERKNAQLPSLDYSQILNTDKNDPNANVYVNASTAIPYLRKQNLSPSEMGKVLYNSGTKNAESIDVYKNLGYDGVYQYYAMKADASNLNPDGKSDSLDQKEKVVYLYNQGYNYKQINDWLKLLGSENGITEKKFLNIIQESKSWK